MEAEEEGVEAAARIGPEAVAAARNTVEEPDASSAEGAVEGAADAIARSSLSIYAHRYCNARSYPQRPAGMLPYCTVNRRQDRR